LILQTITFPTIERGISLLKKLIQVEARLNFITIGKLPHEKHCLKLGDNIKTQISFALLKIYDT